MDSDDRFAIVMTLISLVTVISLTCLLMSRGNEINAAIGADEKAAQSDNTAAQSMGDPWCYERKEKCYERKEESMYHCFHCGKKTVIWDNDYSFDDYCLEGEGVVHELHCTECGATITYFVGEGDADLG